MDMRALLSLVAVVSLVLVAQGQPLAAVRPSLEARTLNSQLVYVARLVLARRQPSGDPVFAIAVEERLKGFVNEDYAFRISDLDRSLRVDGARLLVFSGGSPILLEDEGMDEMTADLRVLRRASEVVTAVRRTIKENPGVFRIETFNRQIPGRELQLAVPVDARLHGWARSAVKSRHVLERAEAARALAFFNTLENIELLKTLLDDEGTVPLQMDGGTVHRYLVRQRAFESLQLMGVNVAKPKEYKTNSLLVPLLGSGPR